MTTVIIYSSIWSPWVETLEQCADNLDLAVLQKSKNWVWPQMAVVKTSNNQSKNLAWNTCSLPVIWVFQKPGDLDFFCFVLNFVWTLITKASSILKFFKHPELDLITNWYELDKWFEPMFQKYYNIWMKAFLALGTGGLEPVLGSSLLLWKKTDLCSLKQIGIVSVPDPVLVAQIEHEIWVQSFFFFKKSFILILKINPMSKTWFLLTRTWTGD